MKNIFYILLFTFLLIFFEKRLMAKVGVDEECAFSSSEGRYANTNNPEEIAKCLSDSSQCTSGQWDSAEGYNTEDSAKEDNKN